MYKDSITGGIFSSVIGDALGVPVEFLRRSVLLSLINTYLSNFST